MKKLLVKNMVCNRCIMVLSDGLTELGVQINEISLGEVYIESADEQKAMMQVDALLRELGFERIIDRKMELVTRIKELVEEGLQLQIETATSIKFSKLLTSRLYQDFDSMSSLFAATEGITLEKYIIKRRLAIVQELLTTTNRSLTDIAYSIGYSSVAHLSKQFRDTLGVSASQFRIGSTQVTE